MSKKTKQAPKYYVVDSTRDDSDPGGLMWSEFENEDLPALYGSEAEAIDRAKREAESEANKVFYVVKVTHSVSVPKVRPVVKAEK